MCRTLRAWLRSRGTIYRYFVDRDVLIEAAIEYGAQRFYREVAAAMAKKSTLAEQLGAMAETHAKILLDHRTRNRLMADDAELMRHMVADGDAAVRRTTKFWNLMSAMPRSAARSAPEST